MHNKKEHKKIDKWQCR